MDRMQSCGGLVGWMVQPLTNDSRLEEEEPGGEPKDLRMYTLGLGPIMLKCWLNCRACIISPRGVHI